MQRGKILIERNYIKRRVSYFNSSENLEKHFVNVKISASFYPERYEYRNHSIYIILKFAYFIVDDVKKFKPKKYYTTENICRFYMNNILEISFLLVFFDIYFYHH